MFDFERLNVYKKAFEFNKDILSFLKENSFLDSFLQNQIKRASTSILANIAEGVGRYSQADKNRFFIISRGSAFEVVAFLDLIFDYYKIDKEVYQKLRLQLSEIVKMLFGLTKYRARASASGKSKGKEQEQEEQEKRARGKITCSGNLHLLYPHISKRRPRINGGILSAACVPLWNVAPRLGGGRWGWSKKF